MSIAGLMLCFAFNAFAAQQIDSINNAPHYNLAIRLFPEKHRLEASGTVRLPATPTDRNSIKLLLSEMMSDLRVEVIAPNVSVGTARTEKVESGVREVHPLRPFPAGESIVLRFSYAGGEGISTVFYLGAEGSFAGGLNTAWYPYPRDGRAQGTGTLQFSAPEGFTVIATGSRRNSSAMEARGDFRFEVARPTFFGFAAGRYTVTRRGGTVPVSAYLLRPRPNINTYMDGCLRILNLLVQEFGAYPYGEFALVEVPPEQAGRAGFSGASIDGFILADSPSFDEEFNLAYYAHEIGHQWWGNLIRTPDIRGSYMLGEGMAQYGALRVIETLEGERAAETFRRTGYPGYAADQSGFGYLKQAAAGMDHRLSDLPGSPVSHLLANSKGFLAFDLLSRTVGRDRFRRTLGDFTRRYASQPVTWDEFLKAIENGAGRDLDWFYAQWFERTGAPEWQLSWQQRGRSLSGVVTQPPPFYQTVIEVQVEGDNCRQTTQTIEIRGERTEFTMPVSFLVQSVVLDARFLVLHWASEYRAEAMALAGYTKANGKRTEGKLDEAHEAFRQALEGVRMPDAYGARFMLEYGWARVFIVQKKWIEAKTHLEAALASPSRRADQLPFVYLQLARVAKQLNDTATLRRAIDGALTADANVGGCSGVASQVRALR
ncbi:MAG: hypothetical protein H0T45_10405 [Pyrinomonadaceae bacterium]|nr:hypothetical protein [Pyrinomonadaceae bacterium]